MEECWQTKSVARESGFSQIWFFHSECDSPPIQKSSSISQDKGYTVNLFLMPSGTCHMPCVASQWLWYTIALSNLFFLFSGIWNAVQAWQPHKALSLYSCQVLCWDLSLWEVLVTSMAGSLLWLAVSYFVVCLDLSALLPPAGFPMLFSGMWYVREYVTSPSMELSPQFLTTRIINISAHGDIQDLWLQNKTFRLNIFHMCKYDCCSKRILLGFYYWH